MARLCAVLPLVLSSLVLTAPELASACEPRTICFNWTPKIIDNDVGEDFMLEDRFPARGTRVMLMRPVPEPPLHTLLDQEGCLTFQSQFAYGHKLVIYGDAWVGSSDPVHLRVQRQETNGGEYEHEHLWVVDVDEIAPNSLVEVTFEWEETDPVAPIMAMATELLHRFDDLQILPPPQTDPPLPRDPLSIVFLDWYGGAGYWGYMPEFQANVISLGPDSYQEKYVVAHEMGHWLQAEWNASFGGGGYTYGVGDENMGDPKPDPPCKFFLKDTYYFNKDTIIQTNAAGHGIRSAEWSRAAFKEGFAHFIAAVAFNDSSDEDGIFRYYKDINTDLPGWDYYDAFVMAGSRVSLLGGDENALGGENSWTENMCQNDWAEEGVSSELDWLRFFWHFLTRPGTSPTVPQVFEFLAWTVSEAYPTSETDVWCPLRLALSESQWSSFVGRFDQANTDMGVYNGDANTCP